MNRQLTKRRIKPDDLAKIYIEEERDQDGFELRYIDDFIGESCLACSIEMIVHSITESNLVWLVPFSVFTIYTLFKGSVNLIFLFLS